MKEPGALDPLKDLEHVARHVNRHAEKENRRVFRKYPITFSFVSLIGFASVMYGLERMFDRIPFIYTHPWIALLGGLALLLITGTIYKWLQNKSVSFH